MTNKNYVIIATMQSLVCMYSIQNMTNDAEGGNKKNVDIEKHMPACQLRVKSLRVI